MGEERRITAWVCDECGYWRQEKSTGVHQTTHGLMAVHQLREAVFVQVREAPAPGTGAPSSAETECA